MSKFRLGTALSAAMLMVLATGCAQNANSKPASTAGNTNTNNASSTAGGAVNSMTLAFASGGQTLDPAEAADSTSDSLILAAYDQLVTYGQETKGGQVVGATDKIEPMIAKDWTTSSDGKTYTFHLRSGLKFQDGNPIDANAVIYSLNHVKNSNAGSFLYKLSYMDSFSAQGDDTVVIHLSRPNSLFLQEIAMYSFSIIDPVLAKQHDANWLKTNTAGSGPFELQKWDPATEADFTANPDYWQGKPKVDKVTIKFVPEASDRVMLVNKGGVDLATDIPPTNVSGLKANKDLTVRSDQSTRELYLGMNNTVKPFDNVKVRQAINYAIPYSDLIRNVMFGQAQPMTSSVPTGMPGHTSDGFVYKHDLNKAKELLKEAGYPNGFQFTLTISSSANDEENDAVLIQSELQKIGVTMNIQKVASSQFLDIEQKGNFSALLSTWTSFVNDPDYHLGFLLYSKGTADYTKYKNPQVDKLWEAADVETDPTKRMDDFKQMQKLITADAPWAYLYEYNRIVAMNNKVKGYVFYPDQLIRLYQFSLGE